MSDVAQGPGWWQASDGRWYPPESVPSAAPTLPPTPVTPDFPAAHAPADAAYGWSQPVGGYMPVYRNRAIGTLVIVLGLAVLIWGVGLAFNAVAANSSPLFPHDEKIGAWFAMAGVLLAGLTTVVIGFLYRRS